MTKLAIQTARFGTIEVEPADLVVLSSGLIGFPDLRQFVLIRHSETGPYRWLQSVDDGNFAFLVVDPAEIVQNYGPQMPHWVASTLNLGRDTARLVYTVVTIPRGRPQEMTVNLAGPIVVNAETGQSVQIVLDDEAYPIRQRVFPEACEEAA